MGGKLTDPQILKKASEFYQSLGKHAIVLNKEVKGHVANRLQAALWREAFSLVKEGCVRQKMLISQSSVGLG